MLAVGNVGSSGAGRRGAQAVTPGGEAQLWDGDGEVAGGKHIFPMEISARSHDPRSGSVLGECGMRHGGANATSTSRKQALCWALMIYPRWLQPHFSLLDLVT